MKMLAIITTKRATFQSPRSGKFVSDDMLQMETLLATVLCFNPLDRGNLYQIDDDTQVHAKGESKGFNPLDRGNLYQISANFDGKRYRYNVSIP